MPLLRKGAHAIGSTITFDYRKMTRYRRKKKKVCICLFFLSWINPKYFFPNSWLGQRISTFSVTCMRSLLKNFMDTEEADKSTKKKKWQTQLNFHNTHVGKWGFWHLQHVGQTACHAKWMGNNWLSYSASDQPDRRASSLLTTACCKRLEMMLLKRWIKQNWTENKWNNGVKPMNEPRNSKRIQKVSRRVPTADSLIL